MVALISYMYIDMQRLYRMYNSRTRFRQTYIRSKVRISCMDQKQQQLQNGFDNKHDMMVKQTILHCIATSKHAIVY